MGRINIVIMTILSKAKTIWCWHENRHVDQWNRVENPGINPYGIVSRFFTKVPKIYTGKKTASSTNDVGKTIYSHVEG
jgi:hypothetical protein